MSRQMCFVVAGDLRGFTAYGMKYQAGVDSFCKEFYALVEECLAPRGGGQKPFMKKFLGDGFIFLYELPEGVHRQTQTEVAADVVRQAIMVERAYAKCVPPDPPDRRFQTLESFKDIPTRLGVGVC
ncbi:MAG: hypothetical protein AB1609_23220, partial [Bacillota bacterium]